MKRINLFLLTVAAVLVGLTSCSKDSEGNLDPLQGEETYASVAIYKNAQPDTRGTTGAESYESKVHDAVLLMV